MVYVAESAGLVRRLRLPGIDEGIKGGDVDVGESLDVTTSAIIWRRNQKYARPILIIPSSKPPIVAPTRP